MRLLRHDTPRRPSDSVRGRLGRRTDAASAARRGRPAAGLTMAIASLALLTACAPAEPGPTPEPTGFASQEEAFAAAEATYRAYVDALNQVDLADPATFEEVYRWTTGDANAGARESFSQMHAEGLAVSGDSVVALLTARAPSPPLDSVQLDVCLDVRHVQVTNVDGVSVVDPDRRDLQSLQITLGRTHMTPTGMAIESIVGREGEPLCA